MMSGLDPKRRAIGRLNRQERCAMLTRDHIDTGTYIPSSLGGRAGSSELGSKKGGSVWRSQRLGSSL